MYGGPAPQEPCYARASDTTTLERRKGWRLQSESARVFADDCGGKKARYVIDILFPEIIVQLVALFRQGADAAGAVLFIDESGKVALDIVQCRD